METTGTEGGKFEISVRDGCLDYLIVVKRSSGSALILGEQSNWVRIQQNREDPLKILRPYQTQGLFGYWIPKKGYDIQFIR